MINKLKIDKIKSKNIIALFLTATLFQTPLYAEAKKQDITAHYDEYSFVINDSNHHKITITKEELNNLVNEEIDEIIYLKVGEETIAISKDELVNLKEKADNELKELENYTAGIYTVTGTVITMIVLNNIKQKIKEKVRQKQNTKKA